LESTVGHYTNVTAKDCEAYILIWDIITETPCSYRKLTGDREKLSKGNVNHYQSSEDHDKKSWTVIVIGKKHAEKENFNTKLNPEG